MEPLCVEHAWNPFVLATPGTPLCHLLIAMACCLGGSSTKEKDNLRTFVSNAKTGFYLGLAVLCFVSNLNPWDKTLNNLFDSPFAPLRGFPSLKPRLSPEFL